MHDLMIDAMKEDRSFLRSKDIVQKFILGKGGLLIYKNSAPKGKEGRK